MKSDPWDIKRDDYEIIKRGIYSSFRKDISYTNIAAVILAENGNGKSTIARRIAVDCMNDFAVLWLTDLHLFSSNLNFIEDDFAIRYLLIIDDWDKAKVSQQFASAFLHRIMQFGNVRIVITDQRSEEKEYLFYLDRARSVVFSLRSNENRSIVESIFNKFPNWRCPASDELIKTQFTEGVLYVVLFAVLDNAQNFSEGDVGDVNVIEFIPLLGFILRSIFKKIFYLDAGIAQSLYHFSYLNAEFLIYFTWEAVVAVAEVYNKYYYKELNKGREVTNLKTFDTKNPICELLTCYINFFEIENKVLKKINICSFYHPLLQQFASYEMFEGYSQVNVNSLLVMEHSLRLRGQTFIANDICFVMTIMTKKPKFNKFAHNDWMGPFSYLSVLVDFELLILSCYLNAPVITDISTWEKKLAPILLYHRYWEARRIKIIVNNLLLNEYEIPYLEKLKSKVFSWKFLFFPRRVIQHCFTEIYEKYGRETYECFPNSYWRRKK